MKAEKIINT